MKSSRASFNKLGETTYINFENKTKANQNKNL